jgi:hypothetical protein
MKKFFLFVACSVSIFLSSVQSQQEKSNWSYDIGLAFFKSSVNNQPDELLYNPVFERWEFIAHHSESYKITDYKALDPFPFNLSVGCDVLLRFKKYFMIKLGYCYTNTLGIGGKGNITYTELASNIEYSENKKMSFTSHQFNYFIGPLLPINDKGAEVFLGFSVMSPTYVFYQEQYKMTQAGNTVKNYSNNYTGFFGNCRAMIGIQVPLTEKLRFGSEIVSAYFNGIELKSNSLVEEGFKFPELQWNFTFRYNIK